jgi:hypothetical protein
MTTWTSISNAAVAVGGIPSSTTVTALRDNPSALAESASGAPVMVSGWHPHDKVSIGDGKTGLIYDSTISGAVSSVITADFVDGYEYRIVANNLNHAGGATTRELRIQLFKETSAIYVNARETATVAGSVDMSFDATILLPRISSEWHFMPHLLSSDANLSNTTEGGAYNATSQKVLRARVIYNGFNISSGKIWMFRRREYASSP